MNPELRALLLQEIETWRQEKLISDSLAAALRRRYQPPPASLPESVSAENPSPQASPLPGRGENFSSAAAPRPSASLSQTFTSETFIKTALYLGAFFVIAAALILAALVETLRLPILTVVGLSFGGTALLLKKRLPQPSFILWLVFTALGWISASVLADLLSLSGQSLLLFWLLTYFALTLVFIFSIWLYRSRFYSLLSFLTLGLGAYAFAEFWQRPDTLVHASLALACLLALALVKLLTAWFDEKFARPLFWLAQAGELAVLWFTLGRVMYFLFQPAFLHVWWPLLLAWGLALIFYLLSDALLPLGIFPFVQAGTLLFWPLLVLEQMPPACQGFAWGHWGWGLTLAALGEGAVRLPWRFPSRLTRFWPLAALPLFFTAAVWPLFCSDNALSSLLFGLAALACGLLFLSRHRWWVWAAALVFFQAAYLLAFTVPAWPFTRVPSTAQLTLLFALLALPDLLWRGSAPPRPDWRWPQRLFVVWLAFALLSLAFSNYSRPNLSAPAFLTLALVALAYALRLRRPWFTLGAGSAGLLALGASLSDWRFEQTFPLFTAYIFAWDLLSYAFLRRLPRWSLSLRFGALAWGILLTASALFASSGPTSNLVYGLGVALFAWLFVLEAFARAPALELFVYPLLAAAFWFLTSTHTAWPGQILAQSMLMLGTETLFSRLSPFPRPWKSLPLTLGSLLMALSVWILFTSPNPLPALQASLARERFASLRTRAGLK